MMIAKAKMKEVSIHCISNACVEICGPSLLKIRVQQMHTLSGTRSSTGSQRFTSLVQVRFDAATSPRTFIEYATQLQDIC